MVADPDGGVWLNIGGEIVYVADGALTLYPGQAGLPAEQVYWVQSTYDDHLWFATAAGLVHRMPSGAWRSYTEADGLADRDVHKITEGPDRSLWFDHWGAVSRLRPDGRWSTYPDSEELRNGSQLAGWTLETDGTAWFLVRTTQGYELRRLRGDETWEHNLVNYPPGDILNAPMTRSPNGVFLFLTDSGIWRLEPGGYWLVNDTVDGTPVYDLDTFLVAPDGSIWITEGRSPRSSVVYNTHGQLSTVSDISVFPVLTTFPQAQAGWGYSEGSSEQEDAFILGYLDENGSLQPVLTFTNPLHLISHPALSGDLMSIVSIADSLFTFITDEIRTLFKDGHHVVHAINNVPIRSWEPAIQSTDGSFWFSVQGGMARLQIGSSWQPLPTPGARSIQKMAVGLDGSRWFATEQAVLRQRPDGEWVSYTDQIPSLVTTLATAADGSIWAGTREGSLHRMGLDGRWTTYTAEDGIPAGVISTIVSDQNGGIWVGVDRGGVAHFQNGVWTSYIPEDRSTAISVKDLALASDGTLWIAGADGLGQLDREGKWTSISHQEIGPLHAVTVAADGVVWVATGAGLAGLESDGSWTIYTVAHGLPGAQITHLASAADGSIWISSEQGLARRWPDGLLSRYNTGSRPPKIHQAIPDPDGSLLVASENGAFRLLPADSRADGKAGRSLEQIGVWSRQMLPALPASDIVRTLAVADDGVLWIGSETGAFVWQDGEWRAFSSTDGWSGNFVRAIVPGQDGSLWIATLTEIGRLDRDSIWTNFSDGLEGALIFDAAMDPEGDLWLATSDGISHLEKGGVWHHYMPSTDLISASVSALAVDAHRGIWAATDAGVAYLDPEGNWSTFTSADGLAGESVRAIAVGQDGSAWFAVYDETGEGRGVSRRSAAGEWITFTTNAGLVDNAVTAITVAKDGSVWFATWGNGVSHFSPETGRWFTYRPDENLPDAIITALAAASDGSIWVATPTELFRFATGSDED
ncbi:MAG: hypothetical protein KF893_20235 [Caldilineaceae bacterium]|nr:hypothetical protein [Caldilineaceae bacterium]